MLHDEQTRFEVRVLGAISVEGSDGEVDPGGIKPRLLLSLLVAAAGSMISTEGLIDGLWGENPPATARKTVQVHVSNLRRSLGAGFPLMSTRAGYRVDPSRLSIDAVRFEADLVRASKLIESSPAEAGDVLAAVLRLWTGPPYADVGDEAAIRPEVLRLAELRLGAIEQRIDADLRCGRHDAVLGELETLTTDHPFRERLRGLQMVALYRAGRQADALRSFDRTRVALAEELGLDPGPALKLLYQKVLDQSDELDLAVVARSEAPSGRVGCEVGASGERSIRGYELRERLGGRGDRCVFRAFQASLGREVAIRVIPPTESNQPDFVKTFEASSLLLADLAHPHIVGLYDYWRDPDGAYIVMPLMRGGTLRRSVERALWRPATALRVIDQIGSALEYAHRRGIVHGDVRAENVLLDGDGNAYLSDFVIDAGVGSGRQSEPPRDVASDVHGLAVITCEMLTGTSPQDAAFTRVELPSGFAELVQRAAHPNAARRFEHVVDYLVGLRRCFGPDVMSTTPTRVSSDRRNPFKGLRAFRETDAIDFFGRDELVRELIEHVASNGLTAVVGPSGSGKSSLVKAGLVPACRRRELGLEHDLLVAEMLPGRHPFEELESALMSVAVGRPAGMLAELSADDGGLLRVVERILPNDETDVLLIIDQFEELFALTDDESVRQAFLSSLAAAASDSGHRVRVVVTLRADFFDRPLSYPSFGELLRSSLTTVALPGEASLAEAIAEPARRVGLEVEPGLIPTILRDVADQPGALPMMQYALTELVDHSDGDLLTIDSYRTTGGVVGALAARAEEIFSGLTSADRDAAREIFLRLVVVNDDTGDTRRRVRRTELEGLGVGLRTLDTVIDEFGAFRLLTFDRDPVTRGPTVEVAHEALLREWPRYRQWIDERRDDLLTERRLEAAAIEWLVVDRHPSFLVAGVRLERYEQWIDASPIRLTAVEREFIDASRGDERQRQNRTLRRRRRLLIGISTLAAFALVAAAVAVVQRGRADDEARAANEAAAIAERLRAEAEQSSAIDRASALMARAGVQPDPDLPILLALGEHDALHARGLVDPAPVASVLYQAVFDHNIVARIPLDGEQPGSVGPFPVDAVAASPDHSMFAVMRDQGFDVAIVNASTGTVISTLELGEGARVIGVSWDRDDGLVMTGNYDGNIDFWKLTGEHVRSVAVTSLPVRPLTSRNGQLAFAEFTSRNLGLFSLVVRDVAADREVARSAALLEEAFVSASGDRVFTLTKRLRTYVYETTSWTDVTPDQLVNGFGEATRLDAGWAANDEQLWVLADDRIAKYDIETGEQLDTIDAGLAGLNFVSESLDGRLLAVGGYRTPIRVFDTRSGELIAELEAANRQGPGDVFDGDSVTWVADRRLVVAQGDSTLIWRLTEPEATASFWPASKIVPIVTAITPSGDRILGSAAGGVAVFDPDGNLRWSRDDAAESGVSVLVSRDGLTVAVPQGDSVAFVDVVSGRVREVGPPALTRPLALSDDGRVAVLATGIDPVDDQHGIAIVDATTGRRLHNLGGRIDGARSAFTSDGRIAVIALSNVLLATEAKRSEVRVVDVATGNTLGWSYAQECVKGVAISHDDTIVASLGCSGEIALLDLVELATGKPYVGVIGADSDDASVAVGATFGPGDDIVIVTRQDGRVEAYQADPDLNRLWTFDIGDHAGAPEVRDNMVWVGATYAIGTDEPHGGVVAMPLDPGALVDLARAKASRTLTSAECQEFLALATC